MVDVPPEVKIKAVLKPGAVFYFEEESLKSDEPHYFVVLNQNPSVDVILLMVVSSSQIPKVYLRNQNNNPSETLIEVSPTEYPDFTKNSIFDCNKVFLKTVDELIDKVKTNKLKLKSNISSELLDRLRNAVLASPSVPPSQKRILE